MTTSATGADRDCPGRRPWRPRLRPTRLRLALAAVVVLALVCADAALLQSRMDRLDVTLTAGEGTTWVLVGTDSRAALPAGAPASEFGTADDVPGTRADVVLVIHESTEGTTAFSVPRDLLVPEGPLPPRLAVTWLDGPQATVDALCTVGIPTDHLVAVDLAGFAATVDAAGGVEIEIAEPVRDPAAGLELRTTGRQRIDGRTTLAVVRSRHPEHLVDGIWVPAPVDPDGRATAAGTVVRALADAAGQLTTRPWRLQYLAWAGSGALTVDDGTSLAELSALASSGIPEVQVLPTGFEGGDGLVRPVTAETTEALAAAGMSCDGRVS
ncbi:transcriptional regulator [Blastococcus saxobsidens]|uniref:Transcriptional regulator n=1 Tax=Blastococcus saxobsidens TaxID=138336 RepID=A0A6L9W4G8_9ACTN|nr:LCP family protein [Blastococcus saxobsidens]NEK86933.1 transcriptional regulator [Blastococcus saxobsidens]